MARITDPALVWTDQTEHWRRMWALAEDLWVGIEGPNGPTWLMIKRGFRFDLASTPWLATLLGRWIGIAPDAVSPAATAVHDYLYRHGGRVTVWIDPGDGSGMVAEERQFTRKEADQLFRTILLETGAPRWKAAVMYRAVRVGGGRGWRTVTSPPSSL